MANDGGEPRFLCAWLTNPSHRGSGAGHDRDSLSNPNDETNRLNRETHDPRDVLAQSELI